MTTAPTMATGAAAPTGSGVLPRLRETTRQMAVQDWAVTLYHMLLVVAVVRGERTSEWQRATLDMVLLLVAVLCTIFLARGGLLGSGRLAGLLYRFVLVGAVETSYFFMRRMLPIANPRTLDAELYALDLRWFGFEPAVAMQAWIGPVSAEWFAFFYYGYFYLTFAHVVSLVFFARRPQPLNEFGLGLVVIFCVGHLLYMVVPGYGPGVAMPELFTVPLPDTPWMQVMSRVVATGGAQKDIFPSIHSAVPTFLTLWSFRHRWTVPYRYTWPVVALFSVNIVLATMYLRWHYLIDVVAGVSLGALALGIAVPVTRLELERRARLRLQPVWPELDPAGAD
jgi:hypothetical protein